MYHKAHLKVETTEVEFALAYAKKITGSFSAAITGKLIYSNLAEGLVLSGGSVADAETVAALDLSFTYQTPLSLPNLESGLRIGLAFSTWAVKSLILILRLRSIYPPILDLVLPGN